jgi:hypothetical protein
MPAATILRAAARRSRLSLLAKSVETPAKIAFA